MKFSIIHACLLFCWWAMVIVVLVSLRLHISYSLVDRNNVKIMNVSEEDYPISEEKKLSIKKEYGISLRFTSIVNKSVEKLSDEKIGLFLSNFSTFNDPDYESDSGVQAAEWLISQINQTVFNNKDYPGNITIKRFLHSWKQPTVILRFEGNDPTLKSELVLLGVDLDTKYGTNSTKGPGDNGGGSAVLLETTRVLLEAKFIPKRSIEMHWYASGKEGGYQRGQVEIPKAYTRSGQNVYSMVTVDTICYYLIDGHASSFIKVTKKDLRHFPLRPSNNALEAFLRTAVKAYLAQPVMNIDSPFGYFYDETSWAAYGVTTAWPIPYLYNVHPINRSRTIVNRALQFAKLATVYAIEMAQPSN